MNEKPFHILLVDDEEAARYGIRRALAKFDYVIAEAASVAEAREKTKTDAPDLLILDVNLPGMSGLEYLTELRETGAEAAPLVIIITAHGSERTAVEAIKIGAHDYLAKPFEVEDLRLVVKNALETRRLRTENTLLRRQLATEGSMSGSFLGRSEAMKRVRTLIEKVAETEASVLIQGESGTGKELVARAIHEASTHRRTGAFVAVNCAALPAELIESELFGHEKGAFTGAAARRQGKFEQAHGGTLFLDEIGDMSASVQAKLLRALEERSIERLGGAESIRVDVRILSATHRQLEDEIAAGNFRADLFYRLRVVTIEVKPLRERLEDVPLLAEHFAALAAARYGLPARAIAPSLLRVLMSYDYPGNVRELRNIIERAVVLAEGDKLTSEDLPDEVHARDEVKPKANLDITQREDTEAKSSSDSSDDAHDEGALIIPFTANFRDDRREFERRYISRCLDEAGGNVTRAAVTLGMHRQSLQHKLRELGLARRYISVESSE